ATAPAVPPTAIAPAEAARTARARAAVTTADATTARPRGAPTATAARRSTSRHHPCRKRVVFLHVPRARPTPRRSPLRQAFSLPPPAASRMAQDNRAPVGYSSLMLDWIGSLRIRRRSSTRVELCLSRATAVAGWLLLALGALAAALLWHFSLWLAAIPGVGAAF